MKISKLYSNRPSVFEEIEFNDGLNVVTAEIRIPENRSRDTHNLGKTTLGALLDFCLLSTRDPKMFLIKHAVFSDFEFFLEIKLIDGGYVTVRRSVEEATKISFKRHSAPHQNFLDLPEMEWDHVQVPFDRARNILDGYLNLTDLKPWTFRNGIGYLLRSQQDYADVFQLHRFASAHKDWKPFISHILGFDSLAIKSYYDKEEEVEEIRDQVGHLQIQSGAAVTDLSKIDGLISIKQKEIDRRQVELDKFDFKSSDVDSIRSLVEEVDEELSVLNRRRYSVTHDIKKIGVALKNNEPIFSTEEAVSLFEEAGVVFGGQIKKDFDQLLSFNHAISGERKEYLTEDRKDLRSELRSLTKRIDVLETERSRVLSYITSPDSLEKYKSVSDSMVTLRAALLSLQSQRSAVDEMKQLRERMRSSEAELIDIGRAVEANVTANSASDSSGIFGAIRGHFDDIIKSVIDRDALLAVSLNTKNHPVFSAEIMDDSGNATSADMGTSYRKLLCVAFDLALLRGHLEGSYPRFVYHDGIFETLDPRKKVELLKLMREYAELGIQQIITTLDSDAPSPSEVGSEDSEILPDEVVVHLHDEGDDGRLFKIPAW